MNGTDITPEKWQEWKTFVAERFGAALDEDRVEKFRLYLQALVEWNEKMNLVSFRAPEELLWRHFADSLASLVLIEKIAPTARRAADLGTGAGFPGIPLKLARPALSLTLVESITKKCAFLEHVAQRLSLEGLTVINDRAENLGQNSAHRRQYDLVLSRAVSKFSPNLEIALPLLRRGGIALIYKTESSAFGPEGLPSVERALKTLGGRLADTFCYLLPGEEQKYCILAFEKTDETPAQYPRRPGVPEKKSL
ncbi:MAG: 16S rRNA (guanine(527)-N(7))-methyltransferase RsmG [Endomicrobiales bacterium]